MEPDEYPRMFDLEGHHWWFQSRLALIRRLMDRHAPRDPKARLLDVGCGTGLFLEAMSPRFQTFGLDRSRLALEFSGKRGVSARVLQADAQRLPLATESFDVVTAFDVMEHLDRDVDFVSDVHRVLRPGGLFLVTVPAYSFLWSRHDVALHHRRRYGGAQFDGRFDPWLWERIRFTHSFAGIFLPVAAYRSMRRLLGARDGSTSDARPAPGWVHRLLIGYHGLEAAWLSRWDAPVGLSLVSVRRKRRG